MSRLREFFLKYVYPEAYKDVDVQYPLPTDGDSIYAKDVDTDNSVVTDWTDLDSTGENVAYIPFTGLFTRIQNSTTDNPKNLTIYFNRTILASGVGLGTNIGGSFSNVKVILLGSGGTERSAVDDSANSTVYTSKIYTFKEDIYFNAVRLEFATTNTITLSNITAQKTTNVNVSQIDVTTNSLKVMNYSHAELHAGDNYFYKNNVLVAKNTAYEYLIVTPNTDEWAHFTVAVETVTSSVQVKFFEDVTTSADGTLAATRNRNRNFSDDNTTVVYGAPTVTDYGSRLSAFILGSGKRSEGGGARDAEEILLKPNTKYVLQVTEQNVIATYVNFAFDWYEHTNLTG